MSNFQMPETTKEMVRRAVRALGDGGQEVSYRQVYEALGISGEGGQAVVRSRISDMLRHGEMTRVRVGVFTYNVGHRPREGKTYPVMWRFVRAAKPGWTVSECAMLTRISYTQALRYIAWLEDEGYVDRAGRDAKQAVLYRATARAATTPETPYPPHKESDPFQKERAAAAMITRLMLCADPHAPGTARGIRDACGTLLARFGKNATQNENEKEEG